jgi:dihydropyrimidinase
MKAGALTTSDDFASGSRAALLGGTTALVDFVEPEPGEGLVAALDKRLEEACSSLIPVQLHMTISEWRNETPEEMWACVERGVTSFKIYLAYLDTIGIDDATAYKVLEQARNIGAKVLVHAEDGKDIQDLQATFVATGKLAPRFHALSRPPEVEAKAIGKLARMVERLGGPEVVIAHLSSELGMREAIRAKEGRLPIFVETCPHYLAFTDNKYEGAFPTSPLWVMSPPLRKQSDVDFLWSSIADGYVDLVSTDHCPFDSRLKLDNAGDFTKIPNGVGGIAERVAFMISEGHVRRKIPIERIVALVSRNAARLYGFAPAMGAIEPGARADFAIWDTSGPYFYSNRMGGSACDYSIYEGMTFSAWPAKVVLGGEVIL